MVDITKIINKQIDIIEEIQKLNGINLTDNTISMSLLSLWKNKEELPKIIAFSKILNISISSISKFLKKYNLESFPVMRYIYNINFQLKNNKEINVDDKINIATKKIISANKVLLVGTGNSGLLAKSFYTNLILKNINAIFLEGKPDQIKMINRMTNKDLIICVSFSMSHKWTMDLINLNINTIFFSSKEIKIGTNQILLNSQIQNKLKSETISYLEINYVYKKMDEILNNINYGSKIKNI